MVSLMAPVGRAPVSSLHLEAATPAGTASTTETLVAVLGPLLLTRICYVGVDAGTAVVALSVFVTLTLTLGVTVSVSVALSLVWSVALAADTHSFLTRRAADLALMLATTV